MNEVNNTLEELYISEKLLPKIVYRHVCARAGCIEVLLQCVFAVYKEPRARTGVFNNSSSGFLISLHARPKSKVACFSVRHYSQTLIKRFKTLNTSHSPCSRQTQTREKDIEKMIFTWYSTSMLSFVTVVW